MPRVVHFEIGVKNPERAVEFYKEVFGWDIHKWDGPQPYWLTSTGKEGPGIHGAIMFSMSGQPETVISIDVPSVDDFLQKVTAAGGKAVTEKMPIPGVGYFAYCQDNEGHRFGIIQADPTVK